MCGRYTLRRVNLIRSAFDAMPTLPFEEFSERARFNIAPSQWVPVIRSAAASVREIAVAKWGLIPSWAKDPKIGNRMINARSEGIDQKPAFRGAFARRRCLVPADGFYEWQAAGSRKQPMFIHLAEDELFCFAGLWERRVDGQTGEELESMTILTTSPNAAMRPIHDRMPVILRPAEYDRWLDSNTPMDEVKSLLVSYDGKLQIDPVSQHVNSPKNDDEKCVEKIALTKTE